MKTRQGQIFLAVLLILIGVLFLLDNLDVLAFGDVASRWWPAILVLLGLCQLLAERKGIALGPLPVLKINASITFGGLEIKS